MKMKPPSGPKKQTQSKPVLSAVEWANFFKDQNRSPENPATPISTNPKKILDNPE
jgi:hypothetical protein